MTSAAARRAEVLDLVEKLQAGHKSVTPQAGEVASKCDEDETLCVQVTGEA